VAIDVGTIGSLKCEVNLNKILMEINDPKITKFVVPILVKFRYCLQQLAHIPDVSFRYNMMARLRDDFSKKVRERNLPEDVVSHTCCAIMAYYRNAKRASDANLPIDIDN